MLLDHFEIFEFRRLVKASAYVGRKTVAFVGPNEAGKSSVLAALLLFDNTNPVSPQSRSRSRRDEGWTANADVVRLDFAIPAAQIALLGDLPIRMAPTHYRRHKRVDGTIDYSFWPVPELKPELFTDADSLFPTLAKYVDEYTSTIEGSDPEAASSQRDDPLLIANHFKGGEADEGAFLRTQSLIAEHIKLSNRYSSEASGAFDLYIRFALPSIDLRNLVRNQLEIVETQFVMFGSEERDIRSEYSLTDPATDTSIALRNLLLVAGLDLNRVREHRADSAYIAQLVDDARDRLARFFSARWSQESIAVGLQIDGDILRVHVRDVREGSVGWLDISERSDGLRTFVALATFLHSKGTEQPPILLIDEAEQHLHINAQADLVRMLQGLEQVQQVIYTTHSPGCLPADLGNGVRFVEPGAGGVSRIRHDFWSIKASDHVGFNPLLIVMGAAAAAFSGLRSAMVVEGAADMLLMPTLIQLAIGEKDLTYQVAPGIAAASKNDMGVLDTIAAKVVFLVDGDAGGKAWNKQLVEASIPAKRIRSLPPEEALEDFLHEDFYIQTLNDFFSITKVSTEAISGTGPIKVRLNAWASTNRESMPGPVAVAEHILGLHESGERLIRLKPDRRRTLQALHAWAEKSF
ncbi:MULTISPECIES: AAA family ATPase [unclassified Cryobacterium]|uniref:AAA family ATPase n=1 Tax=unclassified Cryobacterium TaxID=2649013 RepID=UPI00141B8B39|nr:MULTISPECIES: AAA family ATPase [unclassified Cryobacterium]